MFKFLFQLNFDQLHIIVFTVNNIAYHLKNAYVPRDVLDDIFLNISKVLTGYDGGEAHFTTDEP